MTRPANQLYDLQLLDWEIQKLEVELVDVRSTLADDSRRQTARRNLDLLEQRLEALRSPRRQSEEVIRQAEQRISEIDVRMYSGMVTNPRELEAYQEERATQLRNRSAEEDRLLDAMVQTEETQDLRDEARSVFEDINAHRNQQVAELTVRQSEIESQLPALLQERLTSAAEYPPQVLAMYEGVRRTRGGQGAALVDRRGLCGGCRLTITVSEMQRVRAARDVVQCGSCSRILIQS